MSGKRKKESVTGLRDEGIFIVICTVVVICTVSIFFKLVLGWAEWHGFSIIAFFPSLLGSIFGMIYRTEDLPNKKIRLFNPLRESYIIATSIVLSIVTVFITSVVFDMGALVVSAEVIIVTFLSAEVACVLVPIWDS